MAKAGYGKRTASDQQPRTAIDFGFLPVRERYIAGFIDRLPDGAAMAVKCLARQLPLYGQQAVGSALNALSTAGHLRRVRCLVGEGEQVRWVFRTFWSRTARDNQWWSAYLAAENGGAAATGRSPEPITTEADAPWVPEEEPGRTAGTPAAPPAAAACDVGPDAPPSLPEPVTGLPTPAYAGLAQLGRADARLALSAADCAALETSAAVWFARGVSADYFVRALSAGLPAQVDSPFGFVRRRLRDKLPPVVPSVPARTGPGVRAALTLMECTGCGVPGPPDTLPGGLCGPCRIAGPDRPASDARRGRGCGPGPCRGAA